MKNDDSRTKVSEEDAPKIEEKEKQTVTIEIVRHKRLFEILENPRSLWKVIASLFIIVIVLFVGLSFVVIVIKNAYPYNVIKTNAYGATIMKTDDKEVIYWLFNTAELWANSGIEVQRNDRITIRSSGASNTAIHYLAKSADNDEKLEFAWEGSEGNKRKDERSNFRKKFYLASGQNSGVLLMQIIPAENQKNSIEWIEDEQNQKYLDCREEEWKDKNHQILVIGKERTDLVVPESGVMHFAVNDVVMTKRNVKDMYIESLDSISTLLSNPEYSEKDSLGDFKNEELKRFIQRLEKEDDLFDKIITNKDSMENNFNSIFGTDSFLPSNIIASIKKQNYKFSHNPELNDTLYPLENELTYYLRKKYSDPWFVDNIGSFLIVIERKNKTE